MSPARAHAVAAGAAVRIGDTVTVDGDGDGVAGDNTVTVDAAAGDNTVTLARVAQVTGGRVDGDAGFTVAALKSLESAAADSLAFYAGRRGAALQGTAAGAVILRAEHAGRFPRHKITVTDPYLAYARASVLFAPPSPAPGIHPTAVIKAGAAVHAGAAVGAFTVICADTVIDTGAVIGSHVTVGDNCTVGAGTVIAPGVQIYANTRIGRGCRIAAAAVIGAPGFGYAPGDGDGAAGDHAWTRIEQLGGVVIGDEVDIGAHTAIDRGALDDTVIAAGVKLDNHIQIAHNVRIGEHTIMAGCVAVAGSTVIGKRCQFGGRASILGHLTIADDVRVLAGGFVAKSITQPGEYSSLVPAMPAAKWRRVLARLRRGGPDD